MPESGSPEARSHLTRMLYHIEAVQWLPVPLEPLFVFYSDPSNLPRISPPSKAARLERVDLVPPKGCESNPSHELRFDPSKLAGAGSELLVSFRITRFHPARILWRARIAEFVWNDYFRDIQVEGPFMRWSHQHKFEREVRGRRIGTIVRDLIEYDPGLGLLGAAADLLVLRHGIRTMLRTRHRLTAKLLAV